MLWQRGSLSPEQAGLVLDSLPCDLSFADENDVLLYWTGDTYETCDARFIGRDVRDCHPPESLELLERILGEFKAGTRDVAEGWGEEDGRFKLTRYTAVRAADGAYKGILEVNMDLGGFRGLEGEQRMPGW
jgi:hypothetical protein